MTKPAVAGTRLLTPRFVLVVVCGLCYFLALAMLTPVLPHYVEDSLDAGSVAVGVAVGAFAVGAISLRTYAGRIGDRIGRRVLDRRRRVHRRGVDRRVRRRPRAVVADPHARRHRLRRSRLLRRRGDDDHRPLARRTARRSGVVLVGGGVRRPVVRARARRVPAGDVALHAHVRRLRLARARRRARRPVHRRGRTGETPSRSRRISCTGPR